MLRWDQWVSISERREARVRAYRTHHNDRLPRISGRSAILLEIVHTEVDG